MRQIELLQCVEEWDHILGKSQQFIQTTSSNKTGSSVALESLQDKKLSKPASKADTQKKHCDDQLKVNRESMYIQFSMP